MHGVNPFDKPMRAIHRQLIAIKNQQRHDDETMAALEGALVDPIDRPGSLESDTIWRAALAITGIDRDHACADQDWARRCIGKAVGEAAARLKRALEIVDATKAEGLWPSGRVRLASLLDQLRRWGVSAATVASEPRDEQPSDRAKRRLARLRELGGDFVRHGDGWITQGDGLLAKLEREERAARRKRCDRSDIRKDLQRAVEAG